MLKTVVRPLSRNKLYGVIVETLIAIFIIFSAVCYLAYSRASLGLFTAAISALMLVASFVGIIGIFSWLVFGVIAAVLNIRTLRQQLISEKLLRAFKKIMPEMSTTEKEALNAGTTWFEAELFKGDPNWQKLHKFPQPRLTLEEQEFLDGPVEEVCRMTDDWEITHELADLPEHIWQY